MTQPVTPEERKRAVGMIRAESPLDEATKAAYAEWQSGMRRLAQSVGGTLDGVPLGTGLQYDRWSRIAMAAVAACDDVQRGRGLTPLFTGHDLVLRVQVDSWRGRMLWKWLRWAQARRKR